jgi:ribosome biogenesis GTPase A
MTKGLRKMRESLSVIDLVLEIRDARLPLTTINPEFEKLFGSDKGFLPKNGKKRLVVYNKRDLAEPGLEIVCLFQALMLKQAKCPKKNAAHTACTAATCWPAVPLCRQRVRSRYSTSTQDSN